MKLLSTLAIAMFLPTAVLAQAAAQAAEGTAAEEAVDALPEDVPAEAVLDAEGGLLVLDAAEADLDSFLWVLRPVVIFANTPADPAFEQQMRWIMERADEFVERDVVVITDTDPASGSQARTRLRPRGFMVAIIDKDGEVKQRRPAPRSARELMAVIDRFPLRRQEMLERRPSGRD
ncbi:MAG: DUF4174 domain-containing protein [Alkalilacustris sp.]